MGGWRRLELTLPCLSPCADGYVRGEAVVTLLMQPILEEAQAAAGGWVVLLAGTAVNQGGRSSTLTAPNGPAQQAVIRMTLDEAGLAPASITALSMHGTGALRGACTCSFDGVRSTLPAVVECPAMNNPSLPASVPSPACTPILRRHAPGRPHRGGSRRGGAGGAPERGAGEATTGAARFQDLGRPLRARLWHVGPGARRGRHARLPGASCVSTRDASG